MTMQTLRRMLLACCIGAALAATSAPASAQATGPYYAGASFGTTSIDVCGSLGGLGLTSCDDEDSGFKIFGGYNFNQNLAVELGWVDLGEITATGPGGTAKVGIDGFQAAAVGSVPFSPQFRGFGKVGLYMWDISATGPGGSLSDDGTDVMFGLGVGWKVAPRVELRAEWERFDSDDEADLLSIGVQFSF